MKWQRREHRAYKNDGDEESSSEVIYETFVTTDEQIKLVMKPCVQIKTMGNMR